MKQLLKPNFQKLYACMIYLEAELPIFTTNTL
jgi:hypothetical protein